MAAEPTGLTLEATLSVESVAVQLVVVGHRLTVDGTPGVAHRALPSEVVVQAPVEVAVVVQVALQGCATQARGVTLRAVVLVDLRLLVGLEVPVLGDVRRILDDVLGVRDADLLAGTWAPRSGTKLSLLPKRPVLTVTKLGSPVASSR